MGNHNKIDYIEFPCRDFARTKSFFAEVFGWSFTDYGPDYMAFSDAGLEGGFFRSELESTQAAGGALVVFYSANLEQTLAAIRKAGGKIELETFEFPGGRRFHFREPSGNEFAVWTDT